MLAISYGLAVVSPLPRESTDGTLEPAVFREIKDLIPFHVFLINLFTSLHKGRE